MQSLAIDHAARESWEQAGEAFANSNGRQKLATLTWTRGA